MIDLMAPPLTDPIRADQACRRIYDSLAPRGASNWTIARACQENAYEVAFPSRRPEDESKFIGHLRPRDPFPFVPINERVALFWLHPGALWERIGELKATILFSLDDIGDPEPDVARGAAWRISYISFVLASRRIEIPNWSAGTSLGESPGEVRKEKAPGALAGATRGKSRAVAKPIPRPEPVASAPDAPPASDFLIPRLRPKVMTPVLDEEAEPSGGAGEAVIADRPNPTFLRDIAKFQKRFVDPMNRCYRRAHGKESDLKGELAVICVLTEGGTCAEPVTMTLNENPLEEGFEECLQGVFGGAKVTSLEGIGGTEVPMTFDLKPPR